MLTRVQYRMFINNAIHVLFVYQLMSFLAHGQCPKPMQAIQKMIVR